jgi:hypothetical protein
MSRRTGNTTGKLAIMLIFVVMGSVSVGYQFWTSVSVGSSSSSDDDSAVHTMIGIDMAHRDGDYLTTRAHTHLDQNTSSVLVANATANTDMLDISEASVSDTNMHANHSMLCPTIPTDHGTWSRTKQNFTWTRLVGRPRGREMDNNSDHTTTTTTAVLFQETMTFPNQIAVPWKTNDMSVVFYGSSHLRELYFSFVRLARGLNDSNQKDLGHNVTTVGSGFPDTDGNRSLCDPDRTGYIQGAYGVDLVNCGAPTIRLVPELVNENNQNSNSSVAIGFKTFLHTPGADALFLKVMESYGPRLRHPDILLIDVGIWGLRGDKRGGNVGSSTNTTLTPEEEVEYYVSWISDNFASSRIVWIYEPIAHDPHLSQLILSRLEQIRDIATSKSKATSKSILNQQQHVLFRKDWLMQNKPKRMPCRHGCGGPLVGIMALLIRDWMLRPVSECF